MFWDTQTMSKACDLAKQNIGPVGRFLINHDHKFLNVALYTKEAGKFWYGDLNLNEDTDGLQKIANELSETIFIIPEWDSADLRSFEDKSIVKFNPSGEQR